MAKDEITVINNESLRGVLAPAHLLSGEVLADMLDFIELSSKSSAASSTERISEADADHSWESLEDVRKEAENTD